MQPIQLELFEEINQEYLDVKRLEACEDKYDRLRKSQFARLGEVGKDILCIKCKQDIQDSLINDLTNDIIALREMLIERVK